MNNEIITLEIASVVASMSQCVWVLFSMQLVTAIHHLDVVTVVTVVTAMTLRCIESLQWMMVSP